MSHNLWYHAGIFPCLMEISNIFVICFFSSVTNTAKHFISCQLYFPNHKSHFVKPHPKWAQTQVPATNRHQCQPVLPKRGPSPTIRKPAMRTTHSCCPIASATRTSWVPVWSCVHTATTHCAASMCRYMSTWNASMTCPFASNVRCPFWIEMGKSRILKVCLAICYFFTMTW